MTRLPAELNEPFDHEMAQLSLGLRAVVKREFAGADDIQALEAAGFRARWTDEAYGVDDHTPEVVRQPGAGARTALVGTDTSALDRALRLDIAERRSTGELRRQAIRGLGALLGYPPCCSAAFAGQSDGGEVATFERLLADGSRAGLPSVNNLFVLDHQLISHFPCSLSCQATRQLGEQTLAAAPAPAQLALISLLSAPITVWDRFRVLIDHPDRGALTGLELSTAARVLTHAPLRRFVDSLPTVPEGGVRLCFDQHPPL